MTTDVTVHNEGNLIGFTLNTDAAHEWFDRNVASDGYQWLGSTLWVDHRCASALADGVADAGLVLGRP